MWTIDMIIFLIILMILAVVASVYVFVLVRPAKMPKSTDLSLLTNYAHRGLHGKTVRDLPENSLAAFKKAVAEGYGIEFDLQLSKDGEVMVFHDYTLKRMTGADGLLTDKTLAELKKLRLRTADGEPTHEKIPTLREVLAEVGGKVPLLVELKGESLDTSLCPKADEILREYRGAYCIESFNPMIIGWYRRHQPKVLRGMLYTDVCRTHGRNPINFMLSLMVLNVLAKPHFVAYDWHFARNLPIKLTTGYFGAKKFVWTIRSEEELAIADGVRVIFENVRP